MVTKNKVFLINLKNYKHHLKNESVKCYHCKKELFMDELVLSRYIPCNGNNNKTEKPRIRNSLKVTEWNKRYSRRVLYCINCIDDLNFL